MKNLTSPQNYVIQHVVHDGEHGKRHDAKCQKYSVSSDNKVSKVNL